MQRVTYILFYIGINLFRFVPFWLLYAFGYICYLIIYYIVGYRKSVVINNLKRCFTDKDEKEIKYLCKQFYKNNLTDIFVESLKGFTISQKQLKKRYKIINSEVLDDFYKKNQDVIAVASHYGNWEWGVQAVNEQIKHQAAALYKPLKNRHIEKYTKRLREKSGMQLVSIFETKDFFKSKKNNPVVYIMAADQFPGGILSKAVWINFLGVETACLHGPESYARYNNLPIVFFDVKRVKRGFYTLEIVKLTDNPTTLPQGKVTQMYMGALEKTILQKPSDWLWTHKRWKMERS